MKGNSKYIFLALWLLYLVPGLVSGAIHEYNNVELPKDALMFRRGGMYGPDDTPENKGSPSYIKVNLHLERVNPEYHGETIKVQLAVFDQEVWENGLGVKYPNKDGELEHVFCCTPELVSSSVCDEPRTLILREDVSQDIYLHTITFTAKNSSKMTGTEDVERRFEIKKKGLKYLLFSSCNDLTGVVRINGQTAWMNPFGYLPGEYYGSLSFFSKLAGVYVTIGIVWAIACARYWKELMILQNYVTIVLALGMMEMTLRYYDFSQFNLAGTRGTPLMLISGILHTLKQAVSRLLVLVVSMGFGIVKPSLGDSFYTVAGLGGLFFFFAIVQRIYELSSHTSAITFMQYVTMLPVAALDLVFFLWTFRSLNDVIGQLENREQELKLQLYKRFRLVLVVTMLVASIWSLVYSFIVVSGRINDDWESRWIFDGFFDVLYVLVLIAIMILWRPTNNSTQFAYSRIVAKDVDDDEEYGNGLEEQNPDEISTNGKETAKQVQETETEMTPLNEDKPANQTESTTETKPSKKEKKKEKKSKD